MVIVFHESPSQTTLHLRLALTNDGPSYSVHVTAVLVMCHRHGPGPCSPRLTPCCAVFQDQLSALLQGLRDFIPEQNKTALETAISSLREELEFDGRAMDQIHRALYLFQEAVRMLSTSSSRWCLNSTFSWRR